MEKSKYKISLNSFLLIIIFILLSFSIYKVMILTVTKIDNNICIEYKFNFSNNYIDIKEISDIIKTP